MIFTKEQIEAIKQKNANQKLYCVVAGAEDGLEASKSCILRQPNRQDLSFISVIRDPIKRKEALLNQVWICGDEEFKTDDPLFLGLSSKLQDLISVKEVEIKNF